MNPSVVSLSLSARERILPSIFDDAIYVGLVAAFQLGKSLGGRVPRPDADIDEIESEGRTVVEDRRKFTYECLISGVTRPPGKWRDRDNIASD